MFINYSVGASLGTDKTHVTRDGDVKVWPAVVWVMNCSTKTITTLKGSKLVGYCPLLPYSSEELEIFLRDAGCPNYPEKITTVLRKYFESEFLRILVAPIVEHQHYRTALRLSVGYSRYLKEALFAVHVMAFICKTKNFISIFKILLNTFKFHS